MLTWIWLQLRDRFRFISRGKPQELYEKLVARTFRPVTGSAVIVVQDGEILVVKKRDFYMLPGGSPEPGETLEETAIREAQEETGFDVEIKGYLGSLAQEGRGPVAVFHAEITGGDKSGSLEGEPEFLGIENLTEVNWRFDRDSTSLVEIVEKI